MVIYRLARRFFVASTIGCLLVALMPLPSTAAPSSKFPWKSPAIRVKPGRLVVTFERGTPPVQMRAVHSEVGARVMARSAGSRIAVVSIPDGLSLSDAIRRYAADPNVIAAEPDRLAIPTELPNDAYFAWQWGLRNISQSHLITESGFVQTNFVQGTSNADVDAPQAWDATTTGSDVVVAVLDTGVDIDHPDLIDSMWVNTVEDGGFTDVDDDGNGFIDDLHGWDFRANDADPSPGTSLGASHGTHVAGIAAAERGNGIGIAGICGACRIMALRFDFSLGTEIEAIEYAVANGADIINMSFASGIWSPAERAAIGAAGDAGVLVVAAAGNSSLDNDIPTYVAESFSPGFPSSYDLPTILSVAASNDRDQYALVTECDLSTQFPRWRCAFTSWGHDSVDVAAPGVDIVSTVRPGDAGEIEPGYWAFDGTSMSAPLVAGIAGLVKHEHPAYGPLDLKNAVMNSVDHPSALKMLTTWADLTGVSRTPIQGKFTRTQGRVNALGALTAPITNATPLTDGNVAGAKPMAGSATGAVAWPADVNDVYAKPLVAGRRYRIVLDGPATKDFDLWVWRPTATEIHQFTAACFGGGACPALRAVSAGGTADERVTFTAGTGGVYFIQVQGWYSGGPYTLRVRRV